MSQALKSPVSFRCFAIKVALATLGCFGGQAVAFFGFQSGASKTESNYFSTMSRFQKAVAPGAEVAVVGSSISGRLPGREAGNSEVANLGSDGGSPLDGLTMLEERLVATPRWVVLEMNTVFSNVGFAETPAVAGTRGPWFKIGGRVPLLGAAARPSGMLYDGLLRRKRETHATAFPLQNVPSAVAASPLELQTLSEVKQQRLMQLGRSVLAAKKSGAKVLLVRYPAGPLTPLQREEMDTAIAWLHRETHSPYLDLQSQIPDSALTFTDSVHLGPKSAADLLATLCEAIRKLEQSQVE
jgi:hypothetical protein